MKSLNIQHVHTKFVSTDASVLPLSLSLPLSSHCLCVCIQPISSIASLSVLCLASHVVSPPQRYPDLFPVVISALSCLHFAAFLMWFQWFQITQHRGKQKTG